MSPSRWPERNGRFRVAVDAGAMFSETARAAGIKHVRQPCSERRLLVESSGLENPNGDTTLLAPPPNTGGRGDPPRESRTTIFTNLAYAAGAGVERRAHWVNDRFNELLVGRPLGR